MAVRELVELVLVLRGFLASTLFLVLALGAVVEEGEGRATGCRPGTRVGVKLRFLLVVLVAVVACGVLLTVDWLLERT